MSRDIADVFVLWVAIVGCLGASIGAITVISAAGVTTLGAVIGAIVGAAMGCSVGILMRVASDGAGRRRRHERLAELHDEADTRMIDNVPMARPT
jgi:hypothetical protein